MTSVKSRIALAAAIPTIGLAAFAGVSIYSGWARYQQVEQLLSATNLATATGELIHQVQIERGASALYVGSQGAEGRDKMAAQRLAADKAIAAFRALAADPRTSARSPEAAAQKAKVLAALDQHLVERRAITEFRKSRADTVTYFNELIAMAVRLNDHLSQSSDDREVNRTLLVYSALVNGKELAGQERALGSANLSAERFPEEAYAKFSKLEGRQIGLFSTIERFGSEDQVGLWKTAVGSKEVARVNDLRRKINAHEMGAEERVAAPDWFTATTEQINLYHEVENSFAQDVQRAAQEVKVRALAAFQLQLLLAGLAAILSSALAIFVVRSVSKPLTALTGDLAKLAAGDTNLQVTGEKRRDEFGVISRALSQVRQSTVARMEQEYADRQAQEAERRTEEEKRRAEREVAAKEQAVVVSALAEALKRLASGDLDFQMQQAFPGEYETLRRDFNAALDTLGGALSKVMSGVGDMGAQTAQIERTSDDLARRSEQQAASLEEAAAALHEITTTVNNTAEAAQRGSQVAVRARNGAREGEEVVERAVAAMSEIERSAQQISQIIGVIDEIAFQTNLLALNAGVEAARAGDAGKGFAVVASEVRALAQRAADAAKEIKTLITQSTGQVEAGVKLVQDTGGALERIIGEVTEITSLMESMAEASQEQATGLRQVNTAIGEMDVSTQQTAAMIEEATAASHTLSHGARDLSHLVDQFRVPGSSSGRQDAVAA